MKYAVGYIRVSSGAREKDFREQEKSIINFCQKNDFELLNIFYDEKTESTENFEKRTGFILAVDQIRIYENSTTPVSCLIGEKFDIFAQDSKLFGYMQLVLSRHNCSILTIWENFINSSKYTAAKNIGTAFALFEKKFKNTNSSFMQ